MNWADDMRFCPECGNVIEEPGNCVVCPWGEETPAIEEELHEEMTEGDWLEQQEERYDRG